MRKIAALLTAAFLIQGCQSLGTFEPGRIQSSTPTGWRRIASTQDQARLDRVAAAWAEALSTARDAGFVREIAEEGALLQPDALARGVPSPGPYRCRIVRLGAAGRGPAYVSFTPYFCHITVEGEQLGLTKQTGSERPAGYLWDDGPDRMIFVGAAALGNEAAPPAYGENADRDLVGILERVGTFRYRVVMPRPRAVAMLDVLEMVPVVPAG
jgi:hypothetical protein